MNRIDWNKNNIDIATGRIEQMMNSEKYDREILGIIRAMLWAIGYILEKIKRQEERSKHDHLPRVHIRR